MNLYDNRFVILCFQAHKKGRLEMLDGICKSWPDLVVGLKVETKVGAEPAGDGGVEVRVGGDARGATLQKRTKMLEGWTCGCSENLVAMETPSQSVPHVHQRGETTLVDDSSWVDAIAEGGKSRSSKRRIATGRNSKGGWVVGDGLKPSL
jgi:hypothetical protein